MFAIVRNQVDHYNRGDWLV